MGNCCGKDDHFLEMKQKSLYNPPHIGTCDRQLSSLSTITFPKMNSGINDLTRIEAQPYSLSVVPNAFDKELEYMETIVKKSKD